ncbi:MAG: trifunctional transcriptional regulator/proline dehydrogenase/L-glutamate gamma-semialdehyde dehydrogenase, partial [Betaproteobacteria bacterium]|nr:trifunctional transcriptional regulator/proline dehydrogenase/L-glutamate gamma-semialdehyde dehydrogenase [Betaproteobacteria bacterium]
MSTHLREAIRRNTRIAETRLLPDLIRLAQLPARETLTARALALRLSSGVRERSQRAGRAGFVQDLLREFSLSSDEGIALLCLAEALLRIPDNPTRDALIRDKVSHAQWEPHLGQSSSLFVNAATWGLLISARVVATTESSGLSAGLHRIVGRAGEPLIRKGIELAVRLMGEQFVCGETIEQALHNAAPRMAEGFQYSFDMLGEAAISTGDALRYLAAYEHAIDVIGKTSRDSALPPTLPSFGTRPSISVKLSALHPRYQANQRVRVWAELYPRLLQLCLLARSQQIGIQLDAEESERLDLSLDLLESLCLEPTLAGWNGIGFVVQAYQKRGPAVIDFLVDLARRSRRRLIVRLVKGAYWDSEIKRAQVEGLTDYPVYTRKAHTDIAYLACARRLLAAPRVIDPQFATHNALTVATIVTMINAMGPATPLRSAIARTHPQVEFQGLFGMGESLYSQVIAPVPEGGLGLPCRIYAPVGPHETLLAYLVRRLLENGANSSFVHQIADPSISLDTLLTDPIQRVLSAAQNEGELGRSHPNVPLPPDLYGALRRNAQGRDLADTDQQRAILLAIQVSE